MKYLLTSLFMTMILSHDGHSAERDVFEVISANPRHEEVRQPDGSMRVSKYGDSMIEEAAIKLSRFPRPWTVSRMIEWFNAADDHQEKVLLIRLIAATRSERAADFLSDLFAVDTYRFSAAYGLLEYHIAIAVTGGTEQHLKVVEDWIESRKKRNQ